MRLPRPLIPVRKSLSSVTPNRSFRIRKRMDIFTLIKEDNLAEVKAMIGKEPSLVNAVAPKKPVDTKGMSPLQVSLCTNWHRDIADFLLDSGAAVNYMESPELHIPQAHPVLHDE